ncbi:hypothetical protein MMYC01_200467 [Madurella mycetomatis]|uniref:DUF7730 domain-containing protein n=1 Tax=Madurella mycetomatis TaxID=100816 RepID=A0A175WJN3_9PEZI|nr:hypothetical protein MMYC01_200467 [Madurella mycetomatis]
MTKSFKQWLKKLFRPVEEGATPEPLPCRADSEWPKIPPTTGNYGLFDHLPREIRQQILGEAFGGRTLHIDLTFDHPLIRKSPSHGNRGSKSDENARTHCGFGSELVRDTRQPKRWQWFGCVCHRRLAHRDQDWIVEGHRMIEPYEDECIPGGGCIGKLVSCPDEVCLCESECFVGVMGWLLACRQAYVEGMDVLYGTNTIHMASLPLLLHLPRLLSPQALGTITSVELIWNFLKPKSLVDKTMESVWAMAAQPPSTSRPAQSTLFHDLCRIVPSTLPNLRRLHVALQSYIAPSGTMRSVDAVERVILGPVDDMFRQIGPGPEKEFSLAVQRGGWTVLAEHFAERYNRPLGVVQILDDCYQTQFWKPLNDENSGYWVRWGWDDIGALGHGYWLFDIWGIREYGTAL